MEGAVSMHPSPPETYWAMCPAEENKNWVGCPKLRIRHLSLNCIGYLLKYILVFIQAVQKIEEKWAWLSPDEPYLATCPWDPGMAPCAHVDKDKGLIPTSLTWWIWGSVGWGTYWCLEAPFKILGPSDICPHSMHERISGTFCPLLLIHKEKVTKQINTHAKYFILKNDVNL